MTSIELTRKQITAIADEYSFTATNVEKVIRLCNILDDLSELDAFKGKLALKGGTAINLVLIPGLPRLSVDLDLDLAIDCSKDEMIQLRKQLDGSLSAYCVEQGYSLGKRESYSLCSYELLYDTVTGSRDKIKLDINYLARCHDSGENWLEKDVDNLTQMSFSKIRSQLLPMLRIKAGAYPKAKIELAVSDYVKSVMCLDDMDREFIIRFQSGKYQPELLFGTQMEHLEHHPVALATLSKKKK